MKSDNLIHLGYIDITALFIEWSCVVAMVTSTVFKLSKKIGKDILRQLLTLVCETVTSVKHF